MKKVLFGVLMALAVVGCDEGKPVPTKEDCIVVGDGTWKRKQFDIQKFEYEGHEYITVRWDRGLGLCHNPNCHCGKGGN